MFRSKEVICLKKDLDEFGENPVSYNRGFKSVRTEKMIHGDMVPLTKARGAHVSYSRHKPSLEQVSQDVENPDEIEPPKPQGVTKKLIIAKKRQVLDHRKLPGKSAS